MGVDVNTRDLRDHHFKERPKHTKKPKAVISRDLTNADIEKAGKENGKTK